MLCMARDGGERFCDMGYGPEQRTKGFYEASNKCENDTGPSFWSSKNKKVKLLPTNGYLAKGVRMAELNVASPPRTMKQILERHMAGYNRGRQFKGGHKYDFIGPLSLPPGFLRFATSPWPT